MTLDDADRKWISDQLETLETKLLTEFHKFAEVNDARVRSHGAAIHALELEMAEMRTRVANLEKR